MGQLPSSTSSEVRTLSAEELSHKLAEKFARQCFNGLELYSFKDNFRSLAETEGDMLFWSEDTVIRFLGLPEPLGVAGILFQATSYLGAFPFPSMAPAILDFGAIVKVVALVTGRYKRVLKHRQVDRLKLMFQAFAIHERSLEAREGGKAAEEEVVVVEDLVVYDSDDSEDLSLAILDTLDAIELYKRAPQKLNILRARIPLENLKRIIMLLLVLAPLEETQPVAEFGARFLPEALEDLESVTACVVRAFGEDGAVSYRTFRKTVRHSMPFLFEQGLPALFSHFLFSKNVTGHTPEEVAAAEQDREPLLEHMGQILNEDLLSQLSLFIRGDRLWRRVRPLYTGSENGFSMGSFETKVLKWNAPTILLVSGTRIPPEPSNSRERAFADLLPPRKHPPSADSTGDERVVYGVFLETPWKMSHKECFGDVNTLLFQLEPVHDVFRASTQATEYAYFNKEDGIGFGTGVQGFRNHHRPSPYFEIGPVSLVLDQGLEFGVFTHAGAGGAFRGGPGGWRGEWQDRFEIDEIEVLGCGGESEAEAQRKAWQWEEREALLRRRINLGKDIEADRALLEMAGLIGQNRSGGSM